MMLPLVLLVILVIIVLVLFLPVKISFFLKNKKALCTLKFLCFKVRKEHNTGSLDENFNETKQQEKDKSEFSFRKIENKRKLLEVLLETMGRFVSSILSFNLKILVSARDCAAVAVRYGQMCSLVFPLASLFFGKSSRKVNVLVLPNFSEEDNGNMGFYVDCDFSIRLVSIIKCSIFLFFSFLKEGVINNERKAA